MNSFLWVQKWTHGARPSSWALPWLWGCGLPELLGISSSVGSDLLRSFDPSEWETCVTGQDRNKIKSKETQEWGLWD